MGRGYTHELDQIRRQLERTQQENLILRALLKELRSVLITNKHKELVDKVLTTFPPA